MWVLGDEASDSGSEGDRLWEIMDVLLFEFQRKCVSVRDGEGIREEEGGRGFGHQSSDRVSCGFIQQGEELVSVGAGGVLGVKVSTPSQYCSCCSHPDEEQH